MRRPSPMRQQGFGLLSFVVITSVVALTLVLGYAGVLTRKVANELLTSQQQYAEEVARQIEAMWPQYAGQLDSPVQGASITADDLLRTAGVTLRPMARVVLSDVLTVPGEGLTYRAVAVYMPTETDESNPPDLEHFRTSGEFRSCTSSSDFCAQRAFYVFSSLQTERELVRETTLRLNKVATKAQSYFKARMLQDVERNIDVNYFRMPNGGCEVTVTDLGCVDDYTALASVAPGGGLQRIRMAQQLMLTDEELFSAWGQPLEASNLEDSVTDATPFAMSFRARKPNGDYIFIKAVQQL